jgi:hypothetical protein
MTQSSHYTLFGAVRIPLAKFRRHPHREIRRLPYQPQLSLCQPEKRRNSAPLPQKSARKRSPALRYWGDQMTIRLAVPASLILAVLASTAVSVGGAPAAEECLARPKGAAPAGKHWYYSTNRAMKRKCWFLADAGAATTRPQKQRAPVAAVTQDQDIGKNAEARAELVDGPADPSAKSIDQPRPEAVQSEPESAQPRDWVVAARWPTVSEVLITNRATTLEVTRSDVPAPVLSTVTPVGHAARASSVPFAAAIFLVVVGGAIILAFASRRRGAEPSHAVRSA